MSDPKPPQGKKTEHVSQFYDVVWTHYIPEYEAVLDHWRLFFTEEEVKGKAVLDSGCGTGIFSLIFAQMGAERVIGIDISEGSLGTGRSISDKTGLDNIEFQQQSMLDLPYDDNTFDIVWAWGTVHHTTDPIRAINELLRVLKPGGTILLAVYKRTRWTWVHEIIRRVSIMLPKSLWVPVCKIEAFLLGPLVKLRERKRQKARKGEPLEMLLLDWYFVPIRHYYYPEEIRAILEENGFEIVKYHPGSGRYESSSNFIFKAVGRQPATPSKS